MNNQQIRQLIKNLNISMSCPRCGKKYQLEEIFLRGYTGNTYFLKLHCTNCNTPVNATISVNGNVAEMVKNSPTPPKPAPQSPSVETIKAPQKEKTETARITTDDILEMHSFLKKYKGKISDLF